MVQDCAWLVKGLSASHGVSENLRNVTKNASGGTFSKTKRNLKTRIG